MLVVVLLAISFHVAIVEAGPSSFKSFQDIFFAVPFVNYARTLHLVTTFRLYHV